MTLGQKLKELREGLGLTQGQVATYAGIDRSYLTRLEKDHIKNPSAIKLLGLARALHVEPEVLHAASGYPVKSYREPAPIPYTDLIRRLESEAPIGVPVFDQIIHAREGGFPTDYVYLPPRIARGRRLAAAPVRGDCMQPTINDGDIVIIDLEASPNIRDVVVVFLNQQEVAVQRLVGKKNGTVILACDNPTYPQEEVSDAHFLGVVIQVTKILRG